MTRRRNSHRIFRDTPRAPGGVNSRRLFKMLYQRHPFEKVLVLKSGKLAVRIYGKTATVSQEVFCDRELFNKYAMGQIQCIPVHMSVRRWRRDARAIIASLGAEL